MDQDMPVSRLMTTGVFTVTPTTTLRDAAATLLVEDLSSLVVVDEDEVPVGMFTTSDLAEVVADDVSRDTAVRRYMTEGVVTVGSDESITAATARMLINRIHHLPVTNGDGHIVGMLSTMDLAAYLSYTGGSETE